MTWVGRGGSAGGLRGLVDMGLSRETWKVEWLFRESRSLSLTADGLIISSISKVPIYRDNLLDETKVS